MGWNVLMPAHAMQERKKALDFELNYLTSRIGHLGPACYL